MYANIEKLKNNKDPLAKDIREAFKKKSEGKNSSKKDALSLEKIERIALSNLVDAFVQFRIDWRLCDFFGPSFIRAFSRDVFDELRKAGVIGER